LAVSNMFLFLSFLVVCLADPWLEIVEYINRDSENCPTLAKDGLKTGAWRGLAFDLQGSTVRQPPVAFDCVAASYGLNPQKTTVAPLSGWSLGISNTSSNITIHGYFCPQCSCLPNTTAVIPLNRCLKSKEGATNFSRWFQITPQLPPGYKIIGVPDVPNFYTLDWFALGTCSVSVKKTTFSNNQRCQQINDVRWIYAYCSNSSSMTGCISLDSNCTGCSQFAPPQVDTCIGDFTGFGSGPVNNGQTLPNAVNRIRVHCDANALAVGFVLSLITTFLTFVF